MEKFDYFKNPNKNGELLKKLDKIDEQTLAQENMGAPGIFVPVDSKDEYPYIDTKDEEYKPTEYFKRNKLTGLKETSEDEAHKIIDMDINKIDTEIKNKKKELETKNEEFKTKQEEYRGAKEAADLSDQDPKKVQEKMGQEEFEEHYIGEMSKIRSSKINKSYNLNRLIEEMGEKKKEIQKLKKEIEILENQLNPELN